jgi:hypothetical protein
MYIYIAKTLACIRASVLFIGTRFSSMCSLCRMCSLEFYIENTSTPQWTRQPKPRGCVHDVCVCM